MAKSKKTSGFEEKNILAVLLIVLIVSIVYLLITEAKRSNPPSPDIENHIVDDSNRN